MSCACSETIWKVYVCMYTNTHMCTHRHANMHMYTHTQMYTHTYVCTRKHTLELGNIMILSFIMILSCHDNRNRREIFNIVISPTRYYHKYCDYRKIHCSETFISVKYFQLIFTILVPVALLSDIVIISVIVIITLMIYRDMNFLLSSIPRPSHIKAS